MNMINDCKSIELSRSRFF